MAPVLRVGILNDMAHGPPAPGDMEPWLRLAVDELIDQGRLPPTVEFVHAWGLGLPSGTAGAVTRAWQQLVAKQALLIVGPAIGDNALVATPLAGHNRVPAINWAGSENARSDWMFHLQVGSHEDESVVLARYLASAGSRRIGVVCDDSPIGKQHLTFLRGEAAILGLELVATARIDPLAESAETQVAAVFEAGIDGLAYLGLGLAAPAVAGAAATRDRSIPRVMNTAGIRGYAPEFAALIDGWVYVDLHSDGNNVLNDLARRLGLTGREKLAAAKGYDLGRLVAEGLARAPAWNRDGVRRGLERVKWLPAAEGHEGTQLGFGHCDRGALHGRYLVLRQWRDGDTIEVR